MFVSSNYIVFLVLVTEEYDTMLLCLYIILMDIEHKMAILGLKLGVHPKFVKRGGLSMAKSDKQNTLSYMFRLQMPNFGWPKKSREFFKNHRTLIYSIYWIK